MADAEDVLVLGALLRDEVEVHVRS